MDSILERIANGDRTAADDCVGTYGGLVWRLSRRYLDHATSEIDDAVQDIFIEVWIHAKRFDPAKGTEAAFIATIAHRRLTDRQRRVGVRRKSIKIYAQEITRDANHALGAAETDELKAGSSLNYETSREALEAGFRALPEDERNALWLSVYRGLSHREISEAINVPVGTVKSRIRRAMIRLREMASSHSDATMLKGGRV